jgi:hypothetical protein
MGLKRALRALFDNFSFLNNKNAAFSGVFAFLTPSFSLQPSIGERGDQAFHVVRQGRFEAQALAAVRVLDFQAPGVQHLPPHLGQ